MAVSGDGVVRAEVSAGWGFVLLVVSTTGARVRVWRDAGAGAVLVRSGDWVRVVAGTGVAVDNEPPLDVPVEYWVERADGSLSGRVAVVVPSPSEGFADSWLRSVSSPGLSVPVWVESWPSSGRAARQSVSRVVGRAGAVVSSDVRSAREGTIALVCETHEDRDAVLECVSAGPVLFQTAPGRGRPDLYCMVGDWVEEQVGRLEDGLWRVPLPFVEVDRPATAGAPLVVPGLSYLEGPDGPGVTGESYLDALLAAV